MAVPMAGPARTEPRQNEPHPSGRLHSALEVIVQASGASGCAVAWIDAWSSVRSASVGSGAYMEATLRAQLAGDGEEGPEGETAEWVTSLRARDGECFGRLAVDGIRGEDHQTVVETAVRHVACLLETSRFEAGRTTAYETLIEVSSQIQAQELQTDEILALIVREARKLMEVDVTWLALLDEERDRVVVKVASGARTETFVRMWVSIGVGVGGLAIRDRRPVVVRDHQTFENPTTELVRSTIESEGIVSLICVPMVSEGVVVGALYGGSRTTTDFTELAVSVFTALASQAATAIVHSRLYRNLADKNNTLVQALSLHQTLSEAALSGEGVDGIAGELARVIEREVVVTREGGSPRAASYPGDGSRTVLDEKAPDSLERAESDDRSVMIMAGSDRLGKIRARGSGELTDLERTALRQAATVMALEIMRERAALEAEWRLRGELLEEILQADGDWSAGLIVRAEQFGVDLEQPRCLAAVELLGSYEPRDLQLLLRVSLHRDLGNKTALVAMRGERLLIAFALDQEAVSAAIGALLEKAKKGGLQAVAGLSMPRRNLTIALKEAEAALRLAREAGPGEYVAHDFGPLRFLLDAPDTGEMVTMVTDLLGPIARHDNERAAGEIMATLRAYLELGTRPAVAERSHIHTSTVKYRMRKAADLLGRSLSDPQVLFELMLAFKVVDVLATLGITPLSEIGLRREDGEPEHGRGITSDG